jgi:hypothetical protein
MVSKMKPRVHLETTVISYLTALPSRDIVQAAHQQQTRDWWAHRSRFELYASQAVVVEASRGDAAAAALRLAALAGVGLLEVNAEAEELAARLLGARVVPRKAAVDALHVAHTSRTPQSVAGSSSSAAKRGSNRRQSARRRN